MIFWSSSIRSLYCGTDILRGNPCPQRTALILRICPRVPALPFPPNALVSALLGKKMSSLIVRIPAMLSTQSALLLNPESSSTGTFSSRASLRCISVIITDLGAIFSEGLVAGVIFSSGIVNLLRLWFLENYNTKRDSSTNILFVTPYETGRGHSLYP